MQVAVCASLAVVGPGGWCCPCPEDAPPCWWGLTRASIGRLPPARPAGLARVGLLPRALGAASCCPGWPPGALRRGLAAGAAGPSARLLWAGLARPPALGPGSQPPCGSCLPPPCWVWWRYAGPPCLLSRAGWPGAAWRGGSASGLLGCAGGSCWPVVPSAPAGAGLASRCPGWPCCAACWARLAAIAPALARGLSRRPGRVLPAGASGRRGWRSLRCGPARSRPPSGVAAWAGAGPAPAVDPPSCRRRAAVGRAAGPGGALPTGAVDFPGVNG